MKKHPKIPWPIWFLGHNRVGRKIVILAHPRLHPGWPSPLQFAEFGCGLCRYMNHGLSAVFAQPFEDESSIDVEPASEGKRAITMTATAKRQYDEIMAGDPEKAKALQEAIERIRSQGDPRGS